MSETRWTAFSALSVYPRAGTSRSASEIDDRATLTYSRQTRASGRCPMKWKPAKFKIIQKDGMTLPRRRITWLFTVIGKKNYQPSVSDADREISTLVSTDTAGKPRFRHYPFNLGLGFLGLHRRPMTESIYLKYIHWAYSAGRSVLHDS